MSRKIFWFGGLILLIAVGWYALAPPPSSAVPGTVEVTFTVSYKNNGSAKIKVRSSNWKWVWAKDQGFICYDPNPSKCQGEDRELFWQVEGLHADDELKIEAKDPQDCNSNIFASQILTAETKKAGPYTPKPPVDKKKNGKFCKFVYDVTVVDGNGSQLGYVDPDIMPHGPHG
jgi:hypothetical protein